MADGSEDRAAERRKRAERVVGELAKRGEARAKDIEKLARALFERAERNRTELTRLIQKEIRRQMNAVGLATRDEVEALRKRVRELEGKSPARSRKPSAAKKKP